jgi:hypothetical protein
MAQSQRRANDPRRIQCFDRWRNVFAAAGESEQAGTAETPLEERMKMGFGMHGRYGGRRGNRAMKAGNDCDRVAPAATQGRVFAVHPNLGDIQLYIYQSTTNNSDGLGLSATNSRMASKQVSVTSLLISFHLRGPMQPVNQPTCGAA